MLRCVEPIIERPAFAEGYQREAESDFQPLAWPAAVDVFDAGRNYWLATVRADGSPHAAPVWGLMVDGAFCFSTAAESIKARNLTRDPRCSVQVAVGDQVVLFEGRAEPLAPEFAGGAEFLDRYEAKYQYRPRPEDMMGAAWKVVPTRVLLWNEQDMLGTQTRYKFG